MGGGPEHEPIAVATVGKPRGLGGECRIHAIGDTLSRAPLPFDVLVGDAADRTQPMVVSSLRKQNRTFLCRFEGIGDRTGAEKLTNKTVFVPRNRLPALEPGAYYHFELEGLRVVGDDAVEWGRVVAVHNYPTVDALEVKRTTGATVLVPIRDEIVERIDCEQGYVRVHLKALDELLV